ncbi:MAG TPA: DUF2085 domain-containing protein [Myxococcota bacterium]|nr:DUF2085 domain-containing protein [Myxococcota bacterium]HRY94468.1 DUF2085 domain-containing protein [Myxococcota bacterium]HSA24149.1 DUF2085 domain-containing protein [Myxococcota bacterium]
MSAPSPPARARALRRGPGFLGFLLAHHHADQLERCYLVRRGARPIWVCARCLGLLPALLLTLGAQLVWPIPPGAWDAPWLALGTLPALLDWGLARLGRSPGSNPRRTWTGVLLGLALGRTAGIHGLQPFHPVAVAHLLALGACALGVELAARLRRRP